MRIFEFYNENVSENLTCIRACLLKAVNDGDKAVAVYSSLCLVKEDFDWMKLELRTKLNGLCRIRNSRPRNFCGFKLSGLEIHFLSDDKDFLKSRILGLFVHGGSYTGKLVENQK